MDIPSGIKKLLAKDPEPRGPVDSVISLIEPILANNQTPFFPEYTDHGLKHVEGVLRTAYSLVSDRARKVLTPGDAAVLVLSCILHDLAMHTTKDGFATLVAGEHEWRNVPELGDRPWPELWADFKSEARRFDARALKRIFGSVEPVEIPELDPELWNGKHLKLIGEFLRRHHHRLAHQIALNGVPGPDGQRLRLEPMEADIADLAGLVARSHGAPIRESLGYLDKYHSRQHYKGIHAVFLMALLRVADYLQIDSARAPRRLLAVKRLRSPVSQMEWRAHAAIIDVCAGADKESLFINALPEDVATYLHLRQLLTSLQAELDASWAVLGEVYSRFSDEKLDHLGLCLRRVTSNIDDVERFAKTVSYVPCHAAFDTAGAELMNLLVEPLYGDNPFIAVRELIQNSVDAVREFDAYTQGAGGQGEIDTPDQSADVLVTLTSDEEGVIWLKVDDKGIGMTPETLRQYFLKAGASLRTSLDWRRTFEDETGDSRVLRSGRFGIGVFATLLLGDTIHVATRHISSPIGLEFEASLADESVEFKKLQRPVGTSVWIRIDERIALELLQYPHKWAWYLLDTPSLERCVQMRDCTSLLTHMQGVRGMSVEDARELLDKLCHAEEWPNLHAHLPLPGSDLPTGWARICHDDYSDLHWTYGAAPVLTCNGIKVMEDKFLPPDFESNSIMSEFGLAMHFNEGVSGAMSFALPRCSCFDRNGDLPLNLQRTSVTRPYPFMAQLREDVLRDFVADALVNAPTEALHDRASLRMYVLARYRGIESATLLYGGGGTIEPLPLVSTPTGVTLPEISLLRETIGDSAIGILQQPMRNRYTDRWEGIPEGWLGAHALLATAHFHSEPKDLRGLGLIKDFIDIPRVARYRWAINTSLLPQPFDESVGQEILERLTSVPGGTNTWETKGHWLIGSAGQCDGDDLLDRFLGSPQTVVEGSSVLLVVQWFFSGAEQEPESSLAKHWRRLLGSPVIPYDLDERKDTLRDAYELLADKVKKWEDLRDGRA